MRMKLQLMKIHGKQMEKKIRVLESVEGLEVEAALVAKRE